MAASITTGAISAEGTTAVGAVGVEGSTGVVIAAGVVVVAELVVAVGSVMAETVPERALERSWMKLLPPEVAGTAGVVVEVTL